MAQRRMFSKAIVKSEEFSVMPKSSQALYFHLGMEADDDGFVHPGQVMRSGGYQEDDLKILLAKRFILGFDNGVIVIKHWLIHNLIQKDRYVETRYQDELKSLYIKENKAYTDRLPSEIQDVNKVLPQVRLGKGRVVEELSKESETIKTPIKEEQNLTFTAFMESKGFWQEEITENEVHSNEWFRKGEFDTIWIKGGALKVFQNEYIALTKKNIPQEPSKLEKTDITNEIFTFWNSLPNLAATPFKGKPTNPSAIDLLLPQSTNLSFDLKQQIKKNLRNYPNIEMYKKAIMNYAEEIVNRLPKSDSSYHLHRLSLYDFFLQKNGFTKFVNR